MASSPTTLWQIEGEKVEIVTDFYFLGLQNNWMVTIAMKFKEAYSSEEKLWPT